MHGKNWKDKITDTWHMAYSDRYFSIGSVDTVIHVKKFLDFSFSQCTLSHSSYSILLFFTFSCTKHFSFFLAHPCTKSYVKHSSGSVYSPRLPVPHNKVLSPLCYILQSYNPKSRIEVAVISTGEKCRRWWSSISRKNTASKSTASGFQSVQEKQRAMKC